MVESRATDAVPEALAERKAALVTATDAAAWIEDGEVNPPRVPEWDNHAEVRKVLFEGVGVDTGEPYLPYRRHKDKSADVDDDILPYASSDEEESTPTPTPPPAEEKKKKRKTRSDKGKAKEKDGMDVD